MPKQTTIYIGGEALPATVVLSERDQQLCIVQKRGKAALFYEVKRKERPHFRGALQQRYADLFTALIDQPDRPLRQKPRDKTKLQAQKYQARTFQYLRKLLEPIDPELSGRVQVKRRRGIVWRSS